MKTSESITKLAADLLSAQKEMGSAVKGAKNPFFKSTYADLNAVREVTIPVLNKYNFIVLQPTSHANGKTYVQTTLIHTSGETISSDGTEVVCAKVNDPQAQGSAITYARRYDLQTFLNVGSLDDDGEAAMSRNTTSLSPGPKSDTLPSSDNATVASAAPTSGATASKPRTTFRKPSANGKTTTTAPAAATDEWSN